MFFFFIKLKLWIGLERYFGKRYKENYKYERNLVEGMLKMLRLK